jgi:hypothetical protein
MPIWLSAPGSRLDPPLGLLLDEVANTFPLPQLSALMSFAGERFVLSPADDSLVRKVLTGTARKFAEFTEMYRARFTAGATPALKALPWMAREGHLIGPVITNNFDMQVNCARRG